MKRISMSILFPILLVLLLPARGLAQDEGGKEEKILVGPLQLTDLLDLPGWFAADYINYTPDPKYTKPLAEYLKGVDFVCFVGTWCDDSPREIGRFIKIMQGLAISSERIRFIGLDRKKQSPEREEAKFEIQKVPTIVLMKNGMEAGRIVEAPIGLLEKDMLALFMPMDLSPGGMPPKPDAGTAVPGTIQPEGAGGQPTMMVPPPPDRPVPNPILNPRPPTPPVQTPGSKDESAPPPPGEQPKAK